MSLPTSDYSDCEIEVVPAVEKTPEQLAIEAQRQREYDYKFLEVYTQRDLDDARKEVREELTTTIEKLQLQVTELEETIEVFEEDDEEREERISDLEDELEESEKENEVLDELVDKLKEEVSELILLTGKSD